MAQLAMKKLADFIINQRLLVLIIITLITLFFGYHMLKLNISTNFNELLPQSHEYVKIHNDFRKTFGGANFLVVMVSVKEGTIFTTETLKKIRSITNKLEGIPGIDRYKILSIASRKIKNQRITSWGMEAVPLMWPEVPQTAEEMEVLKNAIYSNERYYGMFVSLDSKKSLIFADFFEEDLDYNVVYRELEKIRAATEDDNVTVSIVGHPMHLGVVASMIDEMNYIMIGTGLMMPILLWLAFRSILAAVFVPFTAVVSGIWGLGFMSLMGYNIDPLLFVMPFLISLMAFRHSHQLYNRYFEEYIKTRDNLAGIRVIIEKMFLPGLTSIATDAFGIAIVAIAPIPVLQKMAIAGCFWCFVTIVIGLILTPVALSYIPISKRFLAHIEKEQRKEQERKGFANRFADWLGPFIVGSGRYWVIGIVMVVLGFSYYFSEQLIVGDAQVGSNLLYPDSRYNQDSVRINKNLPLINPLFVAIEGEKVRSLKNREVLVDMRNFSRYMLQHSGAVGADNMVSPLMGMPSMFHEADPKWRGLPEDQQTASTYLVALTMSGDPGDMNKFLDPKMRETNIVFYYTDKTGPTIERAIATAKTYINELSTLPEGFKYKLAGGVIGVEAAINEMVASKQIQTLLLALGMVFVFCAINFASLKAGLILMIPLVISNFMAFAYMAIYDIGLSVSTLPVSAAGIGMGVDYGIYMLARAAEEKKRNPYLTLKEVIMVTIQTYTKSVVYVAGTLVLGLLVWVLSGLKFQAQMGMMLAVILFLNCLGAVFLVPVLMLLFKPKFLNYRPEENAPAAVSIAADDPCA
ncbi:MAG: MMPL family transporter [Deltaproteobacteria bacterium]|nr:MMPL family transporter [Deltaproteobacteria bacterium]